MNKNTDSNARPRVILSIRVVMMVPILGRDSRYMCSLELQWLPSYLLFTIWWNVGHFFGMTFRWNKLGGLASTHCLIHVINKYHNKQIPFSQHLFYYYKRSSRHKNNNVECSQCMYRMQIWSRGHQQSEFSAVIWRKGGYKCWFDWALIG